ncbi:MauE/DoxX family redox-associated membrane protein [Aquimarina algiphila]|uniref:MauE/DoxX family redox-associated membrane protein n=1 Tax=Aquimarina algiphila TaxID=2047982 RepID=UPI00232FB67F|nr:MauE/DoxX family redox-associated membrane protein [Aquimarina algiphila]
MIKAQLLKTFLIYVFILFFAYTGFYKVLHLDAFKFNIARTAVFPEYFINIIPYGVIALEFTVIFFLMYKKKTGVILFAISMLVFSIYIILLYKYGRYEVCGCGGVLNGLEFKYHLIINIIFLLLALSVIYLNHKIKTNYGL